MTMPSPRPQWTRRIVLTTAASGVLTACSSPANQSASSPVSAPSTAGFTTHAMSGLGGVPEEYAQSCRGAVAITEGLAVRGEEVNQARPAAEAWLRQIGLL